MTEPHDELDTWLQAHVEPMRPPPGTFGLIRKRARRRKARQALISTASAGAVAAVIIVAVVALPKVVPSVLHLNKQPAGHNAAAGSSTTPATVTSPPRGLASSASTVPVVPPVPADFRATSITLIGTETGWVIGQASTPGNCATQYCTSVARTDNQGQSWQGVHAPLTGAPDGSTGVSQIRFLNEQNGWAFGPQLWATHDSGHSWAQVPLGGQRVISLETVGSEAFAVAGTCTGSGANYATGCTSYSLYASPATVNAWQPVPGMSSVSLPAGSPGAASLVLTSNTGYFYTPSGTILSGPVSGTQAWTAVSQAAPPCGPGSAQITGQPAGGLRAAAGPDGGNLALACAAAPSGATSQQVTLYTSATNGTSWQRQGQLTLAGGQAMSLAAGPGGEMLLGWSGGIQVSHNNGVTWQNTESQVSGGFDYVGLTTQTLGIAVPAQPQQQAVWFTQDGGGDWLPSAIKG